MFNVTSQHHPLILVSLSIQFTQNVIRITTMNVKFLLLFLPSVKALLLPIPSSTIQKSIRTAAPYSYPKPRNRLTSYIHKQLSNGPIKYTPSGVAMHLSFPISLPLIQKNDSWGNIATICATASVSHGIGKSTAIGQLLGPPVTAMAIAFLLGSVGFLPPGM